VLASLKGPGVDDEAFRVLSEGAARHPDDFLDDLLWFFAPRVPDATLEAAVAGARPPRLLLLANAHAERTQPEEAVTRVRDAFERLGREAVPPMLLHLALRVVFSLHLRGLVASADAILGYLKERGGLDALDATRTDHKTAILFAIADELARLGGDLPLQLRQVAARAGKTGELDMVTTEAGMAAQALGESGRAYWRARLRREAPTLSDMFKLPSGRVIAARERRSWNWRGGGRGCSFPCCCRWFEC
jgi:hypothetical protein